MDDDEIQQPGQEGEDKGKGGGEYQSTYSTAASMRAPVRSVGNSGSSGERHRRGTLQSTEATGAALYDELVVAVAVLGSGGGLRGEGQCYRLVNLAISAKARSPVRPSFGTSIA